MSQGRCPKCNRLIIWGKNERPVQCGCGQPLTYTNIVHDDINRNLGEGA